VGRYPETLVETPHPHPFQESPPFVVVGAVTLGDIIREKVPNAAPPLPPQALRVERRRSSRFSLWGELEPRRLARTPLLHHEPLFPEPPDCSPIRLPGVVPPIRMPCPTPRGQHGAESRDHLKELIADLATGNRQGPIRMMERDKTHHVPFTKSLTIVNRFVPAGAAAPRPGWRARLVGRPAGGTNRWAHWPATQPDDRTPTGSTG